MPKSAKRDVKASKTGEEIDEFHRRVTKRGKFLSAFISYNPRCKRSRSAGGLTSVQSFYADAVLTCNGRQIPHSEQSIIVDNNVVRVLERFGGLHNLPKSAYRSQWLWRRAYGQIPVDNVLEFNYALLDLGATVCKPQEPLCAQCRLRPHCFFDKSGCRATQN